MHVAGDLATSEYNGRPGGVQVGLWEGRGEGSGRVWFVFRTAGRQAQAGVSFRFISFLGGLQNENENEMVTTSR